MTTFWEGTIVNNFFQTITIADSNNDRWIQKSDTKMQTKIKYNVS